MEFLCPSDTAPDVQKQSHPKPGPFPRFSSSMKGIVVLVWVLLEQTSKQFWLSVGPHWWEAPQYRLPVKRTSPWAEMAWLWYPYCAHSLARSSHSVWACVNTAQVWRCSSWLLTMFFVEGSLEERSEYLHGRHNHSFNCTLGVMLAISFSLISKTQSITTFLTVLPPKCLSHLSISLHLLHHNHHHLAPNWQLCFNSFAPQHTEQSFQNTSEMI